MSIANTNLTDTFQTWLTNTNLASTLLNTIAPSVNTISVNTISTGSFTVTGSFIIPNGSVGPTKVTFLANTNSYIAEKISVANTLVLLSNTNSYIAQKISVANANIAYIANTTGGINSNTLFTAGVVDQAALASDAVGTAELEDSSVTYNKLNANTAHIDRNNAFTAAQRGTINDLGIFNGAGGNTVTLTLATANHSSLTANSDITFANPSDIATQVGESGSITIVAGGNGFSHNWESYWRFAGGATPSFSTTVGKQDRVDFFVYSSNTIHAVATIDLLGV
jgi:hypothetical protein